MDAEEKKKKRIIKLAITEAIMVAAVVGIVAVLLAAVSGYRVTGDLSVEQAGLLRIDSTPTGATVQIDDEVLMAHTNTSRMLSEGAHQVTLTKEGYESWSKTVEITPGWLLRLRYPRLFKQDREKQTVAEYKDLRFFTVAPNRNTALYSTGYNTSWAWINLRADDPQPATVDLAGLYTDTENGVLEAKIETLKWSNDGNRILAKVGSEWAVVDVRQSSASVNLTQLYGSALTDVQFENDAGDTLLLLVAGNLYRTVLGDEVLPEKPVMNNVADFTTNEAELLYVTSTDKEGKREIRLYRDGEAESVLVRTVEGAEAKVWVMAATYAGEVYTDFVIDGRLYVYKGSEYPLKGEFDGELVVEADLVTESGQILVPASRPQLSKNEELVLMTDGTEIAVFDAELGQISMYNYSGAIKYGWLDDYLLYGVMEDGSLTVRDFDGTNLRKLVTDDVVGYAATITGNNRWLYYVVRDEEGLKLMRERL